IGSPGPKNWKLPFTGVSKRFVRTISVVQPPPSAKCGKMTGLLEGVAGSGDTGSVVINHSPRSFVNPRNAITPIAAEEVKVKEPRMEAGPLNGASFKNAAVCPYPLRVNEFALRTFPFVSVK